MDFRHEWKHEIGYSDLLALRVRLTERRAEALELLLCGAYGARRPRVFLPVIAKKGALRRAGAGSYSVERDHADSPFRGLSRARSIRRSPGNAFLFVSQYSKNR